MKISVVVPVYNVVTYVKEFLDSLVSQSFEDFEAVLVDDGSTDGTDKILDAYMAQYPFIRVIHKQNGGCMSAWKKGLEYAQGEYITFADPDDVLMPDIYEKEYRAIQESHADMVVCGVKALKGNQTHKYKTCARELREGVYENEELDFIKNNLFGSAVQKEDFFHFLKMNKLFKRELIYNNLSYSQDGISFGDDVCICAAAILDSNRLFYLDEQLYVYRIRGESITRKRYHENEADNSMALIKAVQHLLKSKGYETKYACIYGQSYHISRLIKKISVADISKSNKKEQLKFLNNHSLVRTFDLTQAKKYLGFRRYHTVKLLKQKHYGILLFLGKRAAKSSGL